MGDTAEARRRAATRAAVRYFLLGFLVVSFMGAMVAYALYNESNKREDARAIRVAYCLELEKLKAQNREDVAEEIKNFRRTLRILHVKETLEVRRIAQEKWDRKLARNAPKKCPYGA